MAPSVLVAMSGGVDSSVAACLLAEQGYDVLGSHMDLVHLDGVEHGCCGPSARRDAAEVARIAGFPFEIADMTEEFSRTVLADFAAEQEAGHTPNPCARCNGEIKFGAFLRRADELGVDMVASGHYVRRAGGAADPGASATEGADARWRLLRGVDAAKDQSYVLHMLGQRELARALFPVGGLPKARTRELAKRFGLPVASKPDSQELCFAPSGDAGGFVRSELPGLVREGGEVVDSEGQVLGEHDGTFAFTVGQRRGLGVALGTPAYVLEVDAAANRVVVGPGELLARRGLVADRVSWVAGEPPAAPGEPFEAEVRIRSHGRDVPSVVELLPAAAEASVGAGDPVAGGPSRIRVEFRGEPQRAIAPGQSAVVYRGEELLGGGRIVEAVR